MNKLKLEFGKDQCFMIREIIKGLKANGEIKSFTEQDLDGDKILFDIEFKSIYSAYLFGHIQGRWKYF